MVGSRRFWGVGLWGWEPAVEAGQGAAVLPAATGCRQVLFLWDVQLSHVPGVPFFA